jgi:hypothetical protein
MASSGDKEEVSLPHRPGNSESSSRLPSVAREPTVQGLGQEGLSWPWSGQEAVPQASGLSGCQLRPNPYERCIRILWLGDGGKSELVDNIGPEDEAFR